MLHKSVSHQSAMNSVQNEGIEIIIGRMVMSGRVDEEEVQTLADIYEMDIDDLQVIFNNLAEELNSNSLYF